MKIEKVWLKSEQATTFRNILKVKVVIKYEMNLKGTQPTHKSCDKNKSFRTVRQSAYHPEFGKARQLKINRVKIK